jgi:predicted NBD/HSP70 family sugar kinase
MIVAVDTGGTKTLIAGFNRAGEIVEQFKFPTPKTPHEYIEVLCRHLGEHFGGKHVDALSIAMPGIVDDGVAIWCNNLKWKNFDVAQALRGILRGAPIYVENDANLGGLAEARQLDPPSDSVFYVTVSTGIGSGIITDGHINHALRFSEAGRTKVEFKGKIREWETFASGKAIRRDFHKYGADITSKRTWNQIADRISRGLIATIPVLQPATIVIGGSMGTHFDHYGPELRRLVDGHLPEHIPTPRIVKATHPEEAVIYGCYYYAVDALATA